MQSALYVGLSAQVALEKRLQTIANNVANVNTAAFRTDVVKFETVLSRAGANPVAFSSPGDNIISREAGTVTQTGNPLDVAVAGQGWLAFAGPNGTVYTRDGRLQIAPNGDLQTVTGFPVVDSGGAQITLDPNGGPISIARNGAITQDRAEVGTIGLFTIPADANLERYGNSGVVPDRAATAVTDFTRDGFRQSYVEGSGANPMLELTRLISASRAFDGTNSMVEGTESSLQDAIRTLGEPAK
ncbi:Flagellar basal-body rod protein FlgG [Bradyrhizobium ivorense]|uniref:Flagellar basal-body rod protein FlgF n=1 Tax=Bradyrhizobium ivorense TaxID=2511166 RepID=A0A508SWJ5_9BRAD|nr:flagellar basal-body rod protein FlgF [Bradyrhizobium ivorense]MCC8940529.1 flagellar basal-body rod protein FlgF [Bradyrhizobium ivorense]VIO66141.1 Flagellar basal-body rod protein FlgG [Bradyrhizobium ivorense]VIO80454.1 Flagellar basal-body rod protein FlgG [Bradyrhizobium ivorense]